MRAATMSTRGVMTLRTWVSPKSTTPQTRSRSSGSRIPSRVPTSMKASTSSSLASSSAGDGASDSRAAFGTSGAKVTISGVRTASAPR